MQDQRVALLRGALRALVESLDATARLSRWEGQESAPEPLRQNAEALGERLGAANRLTTGRIVGAPRVVASLNDMSGAIRRLDAAYVQYRARIQAKPTELVEAAVALDEEIGGVKADVGHLM